MRTALVTPVVSFPPMAGPGMENVVVVNPPPAALGTEETGKQVMVAVPIAGVVQGDNKQVCLCQGFDNPGRILALANGVAQAGAEALQNGRVEQEVDDFGPGAVEDLGQVLGHCPVVAVETAGG